MARFKLILDCRVFKYERNWRDWPQSSRAGCCEHCKESLCIMKGNVLPRRTIFWQTYYTAELMCWCMTGISYHKGLKLWNVQMQVSLSMKLHPRVCKWNLLPRLSPSMGWCNMLPRVIMRKVKQAWRRQTAVTRKYIISGSHSAAVYRSSQICTPLSGGFNSGSPRQQFPKHFQFSTPLGHHGVAWVHHEKLVFVPSFKLWVVLLAEYMRP
jgi:hypothetical protein